MKNPTISPFAKLISLSCACLMLLACGGGGGTDKDDQAPAQVVLNRSTNEIVIRADSQGINTNLPPAGEILTNASLSIPEGALSQDVEITINQGPEEAYDAPAMQATQEPLMHLSLVSYALDNIDKGIMHPLYGPLLGLNSAEFAGASIEFGPEGLTFDKPIELTLSLDQLGIDDPNSAIPLLRSADGSWVVLEDYTIDLNTRTAKVAIPHFSVLKWIRNLFVAPQQVAAIFATGAVEKALARLPQDTYDEFFKVMACSELTHNTNLDEIPPLPTLLDYLGFESGSLRTGAELKIKDWLKGQFQLSKQGRVALHSITLQEIYERALELNNGDIFKALVTAHNVLRDNRDLTSVQDMVENYRGDEGDERGARYHFFGMALYAFAYEHFQAIARDNNYLGAQILIGSTLAPETVATLEESIVSGDIISDITEYAVDLQGAKLGRLLYRNTLNQSPSDIATQQGIDTTACDRITFTGDFTGINFDGSLVLGPEQSDIQLSSKLGYPTISWTGEQASAVSVLDITGVSESQPLPSLIYCIRSMEDEETFEDLPIKSPVTYGDYNVQNAEACANVETASEPLKSGRTYQVGVAPLEDGKSLATIIFRIP